MNTNEYALRALYIRIIAWRVGKSRGHVRRNIGGDFFPSIDDVIYELRKTFLAAVTEERIEDFIERCTDFGMVLGDECLADAVDPMLGLLTDHQKGCFVFDLGIHHLYTNAYLVEEEDMAEMLELIEGTSEEDVNDEPTEEHEILDDGNEPEILDNVRQFPIAASGNG